MEKKITEKEVLKELRKVKDPEVGHNIVDMGLIYGVRVEAGERGETEIKIKMTLTSLGCPLGGVIEEEIRQRLKKKFKVKKVKVDFVFDPPWTPEKMDPRLRVSLGM